VLDWTCGSNEDGACWQLHAAAGPGSWGGAAVVYKQPESRKVFVTAL